jgi:hypothetical protein
MNIKNIWLTYKWQNNKPTKAFIKDLNKYADYVAADYKRLGLATRLSVSDLGKIELAIGADTVLGFIDTHMILKLVPGKARSEVCSPLIRKHLINIYAIYMLLEKYKYAENIITMINSDFSDNKVELDVIQEAQTELMNLELI